MPTWLWPIAGLLAAYPLWRVVQFALVLRVARGLRLKAYASGAVDEAEVPAAAQEAIGRAAPELAAAGFLPGPWLKVEGPFAGRTTWQRLFRHAGPDWVVAQQAQVPTPARPCELVVHTLRADGQALLTMYGEPDRVVGGLPATTFQAGYPDSIAAQLAQHAAALPAFLAGQAPDRPDDAAVVAYGDTQLARYVAALPAQGLAEPTADGLRFTWRGALKGADVSLRELRAWKRHQQRLAKGAGSAAPLSEAEEVAAYRQLMERPPSPAPGALARWALFGGSLAAFWLTLGWLGVRPGSGAAAWLVAALVLHEAGHLLAMKAFGYETPRILFVPLLGAVTIGKPGPHVTSRQRAWMLLAGPLPGLALGTALLAWCAFDPPGTGGTARTAGLVLVGLNAPNLLPIPPLDGGRLFQLFAPRFTFALGVAGIAAEAGLAWLLRDQPLTAGMLGAIAALSAAALPTTARVARLQTRMPVPTPGEDRVATAFRLLRDERLTFMQKLPLVKQAADAAAPLRAWESAALSLLCALALGVSVGFAIVAWRL